MSFSDLSNSVALRTLTSSGKADAPFRLLPPSEFDVPGEASTRRDRIWDLSTSLHCSIIGTCLTTRELRGLFAKLGDVDAKTASDHALHGRAVMLASRRDNGGKLLQKLLDRRHERDVARFTKARTNDEVQSLWQDALDRGDIPGAYWAVLTHPATSSRLTQDVFGEVHMLSHLVGRSNRVDLKRLVQLESDLEARDETLASQNIRLQALTAERTDLLARLAAREQSKDAPQSSEVETDLVAQLAARDATARTLQHKLDQERTHRLQVEEKLATMTRAMTNLSDRLRLTLERVEDHRVERDRLEAILAADLDDRAHDGSETPDLQGRTIVYVGGRPQTAARLSTFVANYGGRLLSHDGGVEESSTLLAGLISRADCVMFPVDCVSHDAAGHIKRFCRDTGCPYIPLRSASLASALTALMQKPHSSLLARRPKEAVSVF
jgi:hypothetical protein